MRVFGFISGKHDTGHMIKLLRQDGALIAAFEVFKYEKIKELAAKFCHNGDELVWLDSPWKDSEFKLAVDNYEDQYGCPFKGYSKE